MRKSVKMLLTSVLPVTMFIAPLPAAAGGETPYAGFEKRAIKALSEQQIADLRAGRGMTLALAAELNGYPGPVHVLEHAEQLLRGYAELRGEIVNSRLDHSNLHQVRAGAGDTMPSISSMLSSAS